MLGFQINNWLTRGDQQMSTGYIQWKSVCYTALARARDKATSMKHYQPRDLTPEQNVEISNSILYAIYGDVRLQNTMKQAQNFSFGIGKDGFYNKTNVLTW